MMTTPVKLAAGDQIEFRGRTWTVERFDDCSEYPLVQAHNASIGIAGFAILVYQGKRKRQESVARIGTDGRVVGWI